MQRQTVQAVLHSELDKRMFELIWLNPSFDAVLTGNEVGAPFGTANVLS